MRKTRKKMKKNEDVNDFGKVPTYCRNCQKKTLSKDEGVSFRCPECNKIK